MRALCVCVLHYKTEEQAQNIKLSRVTSFMENWKVYKSVPRVSLLNIYVYGTEKQWRWWWQKHNTCGKFWAYTDGKFNFGDIIFGSNSAKNQKEKKIEMVKRIIFI